MSNPEANGRTSFRALSEEALLGLMLGSRDETRVRHAASELLGRHQRKVYVWCHRYLRDHERALDLSQEVLLAAYRGLSRFDGRCSVSTWLFVITRNRCLNEIARPKLLWDTECELEALPSGSSDPERELLDHEDEEEVLSLIREHLEPLEQRALWLRCFERMGIPEITRCLQLEQRSGARAVLQRARRKLRAALSERSSEEGAEHSWTGTAS